jgi:hypothetical protein
VEARAAAQGDAEDPPHEDTKLMMSLAVSGGVVATIGTLVLLDFV